MTSPFPIASALREVFKKGYTLRDFRSDVLSGCVVALIAIPLGMALAISSGVPPQHGLYTVILGGFIVALLGGSKYQVSGPTAAFVVILAPIAHQYGLGGLLMAGFLSGFIILLLSAIHMGSLIQMIPHPVTTGFTSGIALVIATLQIKDFFGLSVPEMPEGFLPRLLALGEALPTFQPHEILLASTTLLTLIIWPRVNRMIPAPLVALGGCSLLAWGLNRFLGFEFSTVANRFSYNIAGLRGAGIPQVLPQFSLPWSLIDVPGGITLEFIEGLLPPAFAIAFLAAIESLLSAVVADGITQEKHNPDSELAALGIGNIITPFFGGIAATGAIARTATNIRYGAKSPFSAITHSAFTLLALVLFAPTLGYLPMASLAALLLLVAYNMSEAKHFTRILRMAPRTDIVVLLTCFFLTVLFDMVVGVSFGILMAALLFMHRMAALTKIEVAPGGSAELPESLRRSDVVVYEIAGPMFFGAANRAVNVFDLMADHVKTVVIVIEQVPIIDFTALTALESIVHKIRQTGRNIIVVGAQPQPRKTISKSKTLSGEVRFAKTLADC